jgi:hypothetical protein
MQSVPEAMPNTNKDVSRSGSSSGSVRQASGFNDKNGESPTASQRQRNEVLPVSSPWHVHRIFCAFDWEKSRVVKSIGFGGLLSTPKIDKIDLDFSLWLLTHLDCKSLVLSAGNGFRLPINCLDVHLVLGIPYKGSDVIDDECGAQRMFIDKVKSLFLIDSTGENLTMDHIEHILTRNYSGFMSIREENAFRVAVVLYSIGSFLGALSAGREIPMGIIRNLLEPEMIGSYNWSSYVLCCLAKAADHAQQQVAAGCVPNILYGFTFLLQVGRWPAMLFNHYNQLDHLVYMCCNCYLMLHRWFTLTTWTLVY